MSHAPGARCCRACFMSGRTVTYRLADAVRTGETTEANYFDNAGEMVEIDGRWIPVADVLTGLEDVPPLRV